MKRRKNRDERQEKVKLECYVYVKVPRFAIAISYKDVFYKSGSGQLKNGENLSQQGSFTIVIKD